VYAFGRGSNVFDVDGNRYVDLTAGFGALLLGYPPNVVEARVRKETGVLPLALGDVYASELKVQACEAIARLFPEPGARVMLGLSGADALTCALKTAKLSTGKLRVIAFHGAYHGLAYGPLAACGLGASFREPFADQLGVPVTFVPYPSRRDPRGEEVALRETCDAIRVALQPGDVGAFLVEPLLGRGGCVEPPPEFLPALRGLADAAGALLVLDEVWTGMGRTGTMLGSSGSGVLPDVICLGKGLGGGTPISACVGRARVMQAWAAFGGGTIHTGTHFGSPPACAAVLETIQALEAGLVERSQRVGAAFACELERAALARFEVCGRGMMVGVVLRDASEALAVARGLLRRGFIVLTGGTRGDTLTLSPPLTIATELLSAFVPALTSALLEHRAHREVGTS
jgi:4-aminobutyrate aminotransferase/(S)-3-amino-2-methylpropionate transaminase